MLGNVWEWVSGGSDKERVQRGGGFIDTVDGQPNHAVMTSTRQVISGDSTASSQGFRCASSSGRAPPKGTASSTKESSSQSREKVQSSAAENKQSKKPSNSENNRDNSGTATGNKDADNTRRGHRSANEEDIIEL